MIRLSRDEREALKAMGFTHVVVIAIDVSVEVVGAVQSAFRKRGDAAVEAIRLSTIYNTPHSFVEREL